MSEARTDQGPFLQDRYAPKGVCFGCGAANPKGLRIKSQRFPDEQYLKEGRGLTATFQPQEEHRAFLGAVNGGILGALVDCHGNWTAAIAMMDSRQAEEPPSTVTGGFSVRFLRPTPFGPSLTVKSRISSLKDPKVKVSMTVEAEGKVTVEGEGLFVAVEEGHPAYHRWE